MKRNNLHRKRLFDWWLSGGDTPGEFGLTTPDGRGITTPSGEQITTV